MSLRSIFQKMLQMAGLEQKADDWAELMASQADAYFTEKQRAEWRSAKARVRSKDSPKNEYIYSKSNNNLDTHTNTQASQDSPRKRKQSKPFSDAFKAFYAAYPRKKEPDDAWRAWQSAVATTDGGEAALLAMCLKALEWQRPEWAKGPQKYIKHPSTYLNKGGYKSEPDGPDAVEQQNIRFGAVRAETQVHTQRGKVDL